MYVNLFLGFIIIACFGYLGIYIDGLFKARQKALSDILYELSAAKNEIYYKMSDRRRVLENMSAVEKSLERGILGGEETKLLCGFLERLGRQNFDTQISDFDYMINNLTLINAAARENDQKYSKLIKGSAILAGVAVVILFITPELKYS